MDTRYANLNNWNLIRAFLAVARSGSLSSAARHLGVSQSTLTREIQSLEQSTQLNLFKRSTHGVQLTEQGQNLMDSAEQMEKAADNFARRSQGNVPSLKGEVRISANEIIANYLLPKALATFKDKFPQIVPEIVVSNAVTNLSKRDADIAIRMFRPSQSEFVSRRLPDIALGFFAHRQYLEKFGRPDSVEDLKQHRLINEDLDNTFVTGATALGYQFSKQDFAFRTDHLQLQINLARAGAGIVGTHTKLAQHWPELEQVLTDFPLPSLQCWLVCHSDVQYNARIRETLHFLSDWFSADPYKNIIV